MPEKICPRCGDSNSADAKFCRFCASPLPLSATGTDKQRNQPRPPDAASARAVGALALSIGGLLLCCVLTSVPGAILGWMEINAIKQGQASPKGMTFAQIGLWGGIAATVVNLLFYGFYLLLMLGAGANGGY